MAKFSKIRDVILASKRTDATKEIQQLVPELREVKECDSVDAAKGMQSSGYDSVDTTEWMQPRGCHSEDLHIPLGPMTRSKQARLQEALHQLLYTIQGSLECADPTTLVVIQAA